MQHWSERLRAAMVEKGLSVPVLARAADVSTASLYKYLEAKVARPRDEILPRLADALSVSPDWLRDGIPRGQLIIPIAGSVFQGVTKLAPPDEPNDHATLSLDIQNPIAFEVRDDTCKPAYREGDLLLCTPVDIDGDDDWFDTDCVIVLQRGEGYIGRVRRRLSETTHKAETWAGKSFGASHLEFVARIIWVRRG